MADGIVINNEKLAKARVIEGMLTELNMSKQELIDLIKSLMEQSLSSEKAEQVSQNISQLDLQEDEREAGLPENMSLDELAARVANGESIYLARYLDLEAIKRLNMRVGLAFSLKRMKELGLEIDLEKLSAMLSISAINGIKADGKIISGGKTLMLSPEQAARLAAQLDGQLRQQQAQILNDPNSLSNPNASVNVVGRIASSIRMQFLALGLSSSEALNAGTSQAQQQQTQQQHIRHTQRLATRMQLMNAQMRRHQSKLRRMLPGVEAINVRKGQVFANVRSKNGTREVKLVDYLRENKQLTPKIEKLINSVAAGGNEMERIIGDLAKALPNVKTFQLDAGGKMQVMVEEEKKVKLYNIADYLSDIKRDIKDLQKKIDTKKQEIAHAQDITRGPELDKSTINPAKLEESRLEALKHSQTAAGKLEHADAEKTGKVESKRMSDELVKLDALHDKEAMLKNIKSTGEMKAIESSMKDVMKHMEEAEKNRDMLENLKKDLAKGKNLDKS